MKRVLRLVPVLVVFLVVASTGSQTPVSGRDDVCCGGAFERHDRFRTSTTWWKRVVGADDDQPGRLRERRWIETSSTHLIRLVT